MMTKNVFPRRLRACSLFAIIALLLLALAAPANAQYAGVYTGTFSGPDQAGVFSVLIRADNTGVGIIFDEIFQDGDVENDFFVNPDGSFSFPLLSLGITVTGQIVGDNFTASYSSGLGTFVGVKSPATGFFAAHGGFYSGDLQGTGTFSGVPVTIIGGIFAIPDAIGQTMLYASARAVAGSQTITSLELGGLAQVDDNGNLSVILIDGTSVQGVINLNTYMGSGTFNVSNQLGSGSGTWTLDRVEPLPAAPVPETDIDVTGVSDISSDTVPDVAYLTIKNGPKVRYYSGANREQIRGQSYLGQAWTGVAAATVVDANADGVANDPAVAVLGTKSSVSKHTVEVRRADDGTLIGKVDVLGPSWTVLDVAIIDDQNGDGVTGDTLIAVLGYDPNKPFDQQIKVQVHKLSDGSVVANWFFLNGNWTPLALEAVNRMGQTPLLAVLANKPATGTNVVQARKLSNGKVQRDTTFFNANKLARDVAILLDSNGDGTANDPAYLVLANDIATGKNKVQARRVFDGARLKNLTAVGINWEAKRVTSTGDISGNLGEEVGALAKKRTADSVAIVLKDFADLSTTATIFP